VPPDRPKHSRLFVRQDGQRAIVAIVHFSQEGVLYEAPGPLTLSKWDPEILGDAVQTALLQSSTVPFDPRSRKDIVSPVLQASGEPSPRAFISRYCQIDVFGEDKTNTVFRIEGRPLEEHELVLSARIGATPFAADLGRLLTRVADACRHRKF
jgi:hypothetical protein